MDRVIISGTSDEETLGRQRVYGPHSFEATYGNLRQHTFPRSQDVVSILQSLAKGFDDAVADIKMEDFWLNSQGFSTHHAPEQEFCAYFLLS